MTASRLPALVLNVACACIAVAARAQAQGPTSSSGSPGSPAIANTSAPRVEESPPAAQHPPKATPKRRWYGYQTMLADWPALALVIAGVESEQTAATVAGASLWVVGGPLIHVAHGNLGRGLLSLSLRVGGPALGAVSLGWSCIPAHGTAPICPIALELGVVLGAMTAHVLDVTLFAWDEPKPTRASAQLSLMPLFDLAERPTGLMLTGNLF